MPTVATDKLANALVSKGLLKPDQVKQAQRFAQSERRSLEQVLMMRKMVDAGDLYNIISDLIGIPFVDLNSYIIDSKILKLMNPEMARKFQAIPLFKIGDTLSVAMSDPTDILRVDQIRGKVGMKVDPYLCSEVELRKALDQFYPSTGVESLVKELDEEAMVTSAVERDRVERATFENMSTAPADEENPVVKLLNLIIDQGVRDGASDIHIEPDKDVLRIRFRIDGILHEIPAPPKALESAIVSRIKVISEMDIAETRIPQDGRFHARIDNKDIDVRVSTIPTIRGENVVMRLLDTASLNIGLESLGFAPRNLEAFAKLIARPYGMILVTGPTGSGKTTTLYCALQRINTTDKNIVTIEDPVEYQLELIRQIQVNPKAGLDFANGLRSIVRHDPDVIMVGEIRDVQTAEIAVQSAMTGHLVFSTLHTNDAPGAVTRMMDMGVEPFLIASSVIGVVAQRLVRRICLKCKEAYEPSEKVRKALGLPDTKTQIYRGKGCRYCKDTGYKGRVAIAEIMELNDELRELILNKHQTGDLRKVAENSGMMSLKADGLEKVLQGLTTVEEIARVTEMRLEEDKFAPIVAEKQPVKEPEKPASRPVRDEKWDLQEYQRRIATWIARK